MRALFLLLFVLGLNAIGSETEVIWVRFEVNRTYRDADVNCFGSSAQGKLLFSAEIVDGAIKAAQLQNNPNFFPYTFTYKALQLSEDEMKSISLYKDKRGEWWVTRLALSEPSFRWALYESAKMYSFCKAPQPLESVTPKGFTFEFETEGLEEGIWIAESNGTDVSGRRKDGRPYTGSVQLTQKEFKDGL